MRDENDINNNDFGGNDEMNIEEIPDELTNIH